MRPPVTIDGAFEAEAREAAKQREEQAEARRQPAPPQPVGGETLEARPWPVLPPAAMRGFAGHFAAAATAGSEADPVAVMMTAMTGIGALMGRTRHIRVGDTEHHARLMCALVGGGHTAAPPGGPTSGPSGGSTSKADYPPGFGVLGVLILMGCSGRTTSSAIRIRPADPMN
jgi:hypothetical protein